MLDSIKKYYNLTKPGIIYGNLINATAGFFFGLGIIGWSHFYARPFLATLVGSSLVIACGCVLNNYLDRDIDAVMSRTKNRALVTHQISTVTALAYALALGLLGFTILAVYVNMTVFWLGWVGLIDYVFLYGLAKRRTPHSTLVGSVSGAIPILAGYTAATNNLNVAAGWLAFLLLVFWQMPHFYGIALYRYKDYERAGLPVLPVVKGVKRTKVWTLVYIVLFTMTASLMTAWGYTGYIFWIVMMLLGVAWFLKGLRMFRTKDAARWGRQMFLFSLIVTLVTAAMLTVGPLLP